MKRKDFIAKMAEVSRYVFDNESGESSPICPALRAKVSLECKNTFQLMMNIGKNNSKYYIIEDAIKGEYSSSAPASARVFALQTFTEICLKEKLYLKF